MEGKNKIIFYKDWGDVFSALPDDKAGQLIKHIFSYINDENPNTDDLIINATFIPIKNQLKRDLEIRKGVCERNKENAKKGGRPSKDLKNPQKPIGLSGNPKKPDTDTDTDTDTDNSISKDIEQSSYGNQDINSLVELIKEKVSNSGLAYKASRYERARAKNILTGKDFGDTSEKIGLSRIDFALGIIDESLKDRFRTGKVFNCETIYKHYATIYNQFLNKKNKELVLDDLGSL